MMDARNRPRTILVFWFAMFLMLVGVTSWFDGQPPSYIGALYWIVLWVVILGWQFVQFQTLRVYVEQNYRHDILASPNGRTGVWQYIYGYKAGAHPDHQLNLLRRNAGVGLVITVLAFVHFLFAEEMAKCIALLLLRP